MVCKTMFAFQLERLAANMLQRCANALFACCSNKAANPPPFGPPLNTLPPRSAACAANFERRVCQHKVDKGVRENFSSDERARIKDLRREVKELRKANKILNLASAFSPRLSSKAC